MRKLTKARREFLAEIAERPGSYADFYPPVRWAREQGFIEERKARYSSVYEITAAGRAALAEEKGE